MPSRLNLLGRIAAVVITFGSVATATAQERLPWNQPSYAGADDSYRPPASDYSSGGAAPGADGAYRPRGNNDAYRAPAPRDDSYDEPPPSRYDDSRGSGGYGQPYTPPPGSRDQAGYDRGYDRDANPPYRDERYRDAPYRGEDRSYSKNEIMDKGHAFFGSVSQGLANVVEYAFKKAGRPNGYILGEDAGGAVVAGLRYGEGTLYTKDAGTHRVFWQGPSLGYDLGAEGSKTMVLVYNLRDPSEIYERFGGVQGSAYVIGGVSIQFQKRGDVILAPIRSGVGLRLGANVGYLKYTRRPTWNPF